LDLTGANLIAGEWVAGGDIAFHAVAPATGETLQPAFHAAGVAEVERACVSAEAAFQAYSETTPDQRAAFLEACAAELEGDGEALVERAIAESGLPRARLEGERGRTCGQLRLFAAEIREGAWMGLRIDRAMPDRKPLPRPDLRLRKVALGPVAVFGASNFPLAFSVAGGDTASALAAGCPVVVKGHPAHPGTGEIAARALQRAVKRSGLPDGVVQLLNGPSLELGSALVRDPRIQAVGFTGSRGGGLALVRLAGERPVPIPVYAEMSSINPVFLLPAALKARTEALASGFSTSLTMGAGQFCTNPGLVLALDGPDLDRFVELASAALAQAPPAVMLSPGIHRAYEAGVETLSGRPGVCERARGLTGEGVNQGRAGLFETTAEHVLADEALTHEVFGASSLVVRCRDVAQMARVAAHLEGQLTATLQMDADDQEAARALLPILQRRAGRILANGWPTGVEVGHAMVHGGPFPATSDGRSTSVGSLAIERFLRPVCYQDLPNALLPAALRDDASGAPRRINGIREG
jgi:2,5-dioxopentanoate dehydrogenase